MNKQLVSIIIPIYNAEKTLHSCLRSVTSQTYERLEIILVNDGSTDNSLNICYQFAQRDGRIKVIDQPNRGPSYARNVGINEAQGTFIQFVDADDEIKKSMTEQLIHVIDSKIDLVICGYFMRRNREQYTFKPNIKEALSIKQFNDKVGLFYFKQLLPSPCNKLYRTSVIKKNNVTFPINVYLGEDLLFNLNYFNYCRNVKTLNEPLYFYNVNEHSLSNQMNEQYFNQQLLLIDQVKAYLRKYDSETSDNERYLHYIFAQSIINTLSQFSIQSTHDKKRFMHTVEKLYTNEKVANKLTNFNGTIQMKIVKILFRFKLKRMTYLFFKIKQFLKRRITHVYLHLKRMNEQSKRLSIKEGK